LGGAVLLVVGALLAVSCVLIFFRSRTTVIPHSTPSNLVASGPYRFTRNPMYVGLTLAYLGLSAVLNHAWPVVLLPAVLVVLTQFVIEREEAHLAERFGEEYERYRRHVRRWL
jgi:protein-S-isoprenylcysteine O-methyltransferase Ste14